MTMTPEEKRALIEEARETSTFEAGSDVDSAYYWAGLADRLADALEATPDTTDENPETETEWEYRVIVPDSERGNIPAEDGLTTLEMAEAYVRRQDGEFIERRQVGPWLPLPERGEG